MTNPKTTPRWRVAQVVTANSEGCIALICGAEIVARFTNWQDARKAYRAAVARGGREG